MSHGSQALGLDLSEASDRSRDQETGRQVGCWLSLAVEASGQDPS